MEQLDKACSQYDCELIIKLMSKMVVEYTPSKEIMDTLWFKKEQTGKDNDDARRDDNVVKLKP